MKTRRLYRLRWLDHRITEIERPPWEPLRVIRGYIADNLARARRYLGRAVAHWPEDLNKTGTITITAGRDPRSALWARWILEEQDDYYRGRGYYQIGEPERIKALVREGAGSNSGPRGCATGPQE